MPEEITIKIAGEAGQGTQTIGEAMYKLYKKAGLNIFANVDFMSRIRGGNNFFQIRVSEEPVFTLRKLSDITIALDKASLEIHKKGMAKDGIFIIDSKNFGITDKDETFFDVPFYDMAKKTGGSELFVNSVAFGILASITGVKLDYVSGVLKYIFADKGEEIIKKNLESAKAGYDLAFENFKDRRFAMREFKEKKELLLNGNYAMALGIIRAGCKFYSAYPMSPSTSIMENIAYFSKAFNVVVEQAEDEIAAINMVIGAACTGVRSMCATSGGGFALMAEGLSLAGMFEAPVVVGVAQRPGPATGFPTRTEQAELNFVIHAGHGEFARIVYAPGTVEQAFYLAVKAFNMAEKFQIPVLIMTDQHLADSFRNVEFFDLTKAKVERSIISKRDSENVENYIRYKQTDSGISPMAVPSWIKDCIWMDSDEHTQEGHITEDADIRVKMVEKRFYKKMALISKEIEAPFSYKLEVAEIVLIGFGSTYGAMKEACDYLTDKKIGFVHLCQVWPFPTDALAAILKGKDKIISVENNAGAQLASLIRKETGIEIKKSILKFDGRPFDLDFLVERIGEVNF